jgi:nitroreductase
MQCWRYILVSDAALKARLGELLNNPSAGCYRDAPFALCALRMQAGERIGGREGILSGGQRDLHGACGFGGNGGGLATCWVGLFTEHLCANC